MLSPFIALASGVGRRFSLILGADAALSGHGAHAAARSRRRCRLGDMLLGIRSERYGAAFARFQRLILPDTDC